MLDTEMAKQFTGFLKKEIADYGDTLENICAKSIGRKYRPWLSKLINGRAQPFSTSLSTARTFAICETLGIGKVELLMKCGILKKRDVFFWHSKNCILRSENEDFIRNTNGPIRKKCIPRI